MRFYVLTLAVLAVWRITHLLHAEDGPWNLLFRLRKLAGAGFGGNLMDCFYCLSLWVAVPIAFLVPATWLERFLWWPALSAAAILLERLTSSRGEEAPALYFEDEETPDVLLRKAGSATEAAAESISASSNRISRPRR